MSLSLDTKNNTSIIKSMILQITCNNIIIMKNVITLIIILMCCHFSWHFVATLLHDSR